MVKRPSKRGGTSPSNVDRAAEQVKPEDTCEALPPGWACVRLGELGMGRTENIEPAEKPDEEFELWSVPSFPSGKPEAVRGNAVGSNKQRVREGDVLLCKINPRINRVWRVSAHKGKTQIASTEWIVFRSAVFASDYLMWRFREGRFRELLHKTVAGVGGSLTRARPQEVAKIAICLPPVAEQQRIASRLETLEGYSRRARAALSALPSLIAQARQSILAAAFGGFLTADWREANPASEPSLALRKRLAEARSTAWQKRRGLYQQDVDAKHYKPLTPPTEEFLFEIPDDWEVVSIDELTTLITSGSRDWTRHYRTNGSGTFIMAQNIRPLFLDFSSRQRVSPPDDRDRVRSQVEEGDILATIVGANTGDVCRVPCPLPEHYVCQSVALMRPVLPEMSCFLNYYMNSPRHGQWQFDEWMYGEGRPHLSFDHLREIAVVLPPLAEQGEIVRRLDEAFARLDATAAAHAAAVAELDRLDASLLAKAFRGELVPQDPSDEPVAVTLQRLRTPREVVDPVAYLFQFIPALLRASDGALLFARVLEGCALLRVPRDLVRLLEPLGGAPAHQHFERFAQPLNDGSFVPVLRNLIAAGAITHDSRAAHMLRLVEAKAPPIAPLIAEDARYVARVLALVPTEALEDLTPPHVRKLCPNAAAVTLAF